MWISSLFQTGMRKLFILGLVSSLAACGGGGGGGKKPDPVTPSSSPVSSLSSSALSSFSSNIPLSSSLTSSSVSSLGNSSNGSSLSSSQGGSSIGSLGNSSRSSTSSVVVVPIDTTPDSFSLTAVTGAALNANVTSAVITISGINTAVPISIVNGEYSINGGAFTSAAGTVTNGQTVVVSLATAATLGATTQATLTIGGVAQIFSVTTELPDTAPNAFSFTAVTGAALSATVNSAAITISGINTASPISITGGQYSVAGGAATSAAGTITNGQTVVVSLTTAATLGVTTQATLTVGGVARTFSVTTELPDTTPDAFSFTAVTGAALSTTISSTPVTISGINTAAPISITGGQYSIAGGAFTSAARTITNGQTMVVRLTSAAAPSTTTQTTVTIGGVAQTFSVTTELPDTTPDPFSFTAVTGAAVSATVNSNVITVSGINTATPTSITGGQYSIAGGTATNTTGTVTNGQTVVVSLTSSATPNTTTQATLTIGGVAQTFSVMTELPDTIPDVFSFNAVITASLNTVKISNLVSVTGINMAAPISITNGEYSINGGAFTSVAGTVSNGQTLSVKTISAASIDSTTQTVVTVGGTANSFSVTTVSPQLGGAIQGSTLNIAGVVTTTAGTPADVDGIGTAAKFNSPQGSVIVGAYLYVADSSNNKIRKIDIATGVVTTLAGSGSQGSADGIGAAASFNQPEGITTDATHLYVADTLNNKIRKIEIATGVVTTLAGSGSQGSADGIGAAASFYHPEGITADATHLYVADSSNNKIRKIDIATGVVTTLAGYFSSGATDGTGAAARFSRPTGITTDGTHLYVADTYNHQIRKIEIATGVVTRLAGSSLRISGSADGTGGTFTYPEGITTDATHLYVADTYNHKIRKVEKATGVVTTLAGSVANADGTGAAAYFWSPEGITTDGTHLYVADRMNNKIRKIEKATGVVTMLAGSGSIGSVDGTAAAASFRYPASITTDGTHLYVVETTSNRIRKIEVATGVVTTLAGSGSLGSADGTGAAASFRQPAGITTDGTHLYVTDTGNNKIRKIEIATSAVTTLAGSGSNGSANGTGTAASFSEPRGITTDGSHLYVADRLNNKIRKIVIATGVVTALAGSASSGNADGTGAAARFYNPAGITTDGTHLYVTDSGNNKIRKIEIATGVVTSLAGSESIGSADGVGTAAQFNNPTGITTDGFSLFVADTENNTIRKIE